MYAYYLTLLSFAVMLLKIQHQPYAWELDFTKSRNNDTHRMRKKETPFTVKKKKGNKHQQQRNFQLSNFLSLCIVYFPSFFLLSHLPSLQRWWYIHCFDSVLLVVRISKLMPIRFVFFSPFSNINKMILHYGCNMMLFAHLSIISHLT